MQQTQRLLTLSILSILFGVVSLPASAQTLDVQQAAEYDTGFDCPASATLDPTATTLWVLMNNCGSGDYSLRGFRTADGSPVNDDASSFADALTALDDAPFFSYNTPIAFTPDGMLDIRYNAGEDYDSFSIQIPIQNAAAEGETILLNLETVNDLIPGYAGYLETTVYNTDHTLAVVMDTLRYHIIDLQTGTQVLAIDEPGGTEIAFPAFSQDGQRLYIARFHNPDDYTDYSGTLSIYNLSDGELLQTYDVPSALLWVSPNEQYAATVYDNVDGNSEVVVVELATGALSQILPMYEPPFHVTTCLNDGRDVSDVDFRASGRLSLSQLNWLPDSSGFFTVNSYGGEAAGGGRVCFFNYSRMRHYHVG